MKNFKILFALIPALCMVSCNFLDLSDPNSVTVANYYTSEDDILSSLYGVYASQKAQYYIRDNYYFTDTRAHVTVVTDSGGDNGVPYQFYNFTLTEANVYVYNRYAQMYELIARANKLISHLDDVEYSDSSSRDTYEAEARYLRAQTYFFLVTEWGDVPLVLESMETVSDVNEHNVRVDKAEVYQAIFDDLDFVVNSPLQDICPGSECGRASKAAAYGLWGKALLHCARDDDFASQASNYLATAKEKLLACWNLRTFGELSEIPFNEIWDLSTQKSCAENIFQVNYIQGNADLGSIWNYSFAPAETGISSWHSSSRNNTCLQQFYDMYEDGDVRKDYLYEFVYGGVTYFATLKYVDLDCGTDGYGGNNWIILRYADVALMLAEAYYWSGDSSTAQTYLNMVRKRAGLADWSGSDLRDGIYDERLREFMQEGQVWEDYLRRFTDSEMVAYFNAINSNFSSQDLLLPIPYNERILNPEGLYQNPGY